MNGDGTSSPDQVDLGDGSFLQLPRQGMSSDEVNAEIAKFKAQQQQAQTQAGQGDAPQLTGPLRDPAMIASGMTKGAITGAGAVGDLGDLGQSLFGKYVYDPYIHPAVSTAMTKIFGPPSPEGVARAQTLNQPGPLSSPSLLAAPRAIGAVDNPALTPQNADERYLTATSEAAGGALPYLWMGGVSPVRAAVGAGAGGAAGEAGAEMFPEHPVLARTIGNLAVGGAVTGAPRAAPTPLGAAFNRLDITPVPADLTGPTGLRRWFTAKAADMPGAGALRTAQANAVDQWGNALEDTARSLGPATTAQDAGTALQNASQDWLQRFRTNSRQVWNDVTMQIPQNTPTNVTNYAQTLAAVRNSMPTAPATAATLQPALTRNLLDNLISDVQGGPLDWQTVSGIRTRIGEMLSDPNLVADTSTADLRRIYRALSQDMQSTASSMGPRVQSLFDQANRFTSMGHDYIDNTISPLLGPRDAPFSPEQAYRNAMTNARLGGTMLKNIRDGMPGAADTLASYELRRMGTATPGQQPVPGQGPQVSPNTFVTNTNKLSPQASDALFPGVQQQLDDLTQTAGAMRQTATATNTSRTGGYLSAKELLGLPLTIAGGVGGGYGLGGIPGAIIGGTTAALWPFTPGFVGRTLALRDLKNYPGLLTQPLRSYGGAAQ